MKNIPILLYLALTLLACQTEEPLQATVEAPESTRNAALSLTQAQVNMAGITFDSLRVRAFKEEVHATGTVDLPPEYRASVSIYFGGYVSKIKLIEGEQVRRGQVLFYLENPEYIRLQQSFLEVKSQLRHLKSSYERQQKLLTDQASSEKANSKAQMQYEVANVQYESLKKQLQLMGLSTEQITANNIQDRIAVKAPISGFVSSIHITQGQYLNPTDIALSIFNTEHLHLELAVFEKDYPKMAKGLPIRFFLPNNPSNQYKGSIYLPARSIDIESRQGKVHAHISDEHANTPFAPGMYVEAHIQLQEQLLPSLPQSALLEENGKYFVWMKLNTDSSESTLKKVEVEIGEQTEEYIAIKNANSLPPNALFIVKGGLQLGGEA